MTAINRRCARHSGIEYVVVEKVILYQILLELVDYCRLYMVRSRGCNLLLLCRRGEECIQRPFAR